MRTNRPKAHQQSAESEKALSRRRFLGATLATAALSSMGILTSLAAGYVFHSAAPGQPGARTLTNAVFQLTLEPGRDEVRARLTVLPSRLRVADGACFYSADRIQSAGRTPYRGLQNAALLRGTRSLTIRGRLAGLDVDHTFVISAARPILEERVRLHNPSSSEVALTDFHAALQRPLTDASGNVLTELASDRWVAVPLRVRATDAKGHVNDWCAPDLVTRLGYEPHIDQNLRYTQVPSPRHVSEGWAWTHGEHALGIFVYNQTNLLYSVLSAEREPSGVMLRFGGACMVSGGPDALTRIRPGETVDLGTVRYQALAGGYVEAMYAFRSMLDEHGSHFPKDYAPPVHWEQLYDMEGAWSDRRHKYTKAILDREAQKAVAYSCEALYLDPGWDTEFGTFLWGDAWLGPRRQFVADLQSRFGLKLALHCPLATWVSHPRFGGFNMGPNWWESWPSASRRTPPPDESRADEWLVPAVRGGRRNLALSPAARATASSTLSGFAIHRVEHLQDGWFGNPASWIAAQLPAWAELDLGEVQRIGEVRLGNDHRGEYSDRGATRLRVLTATNHAADSNAEKWRAVAHHDGEPLRSEKVFACAPTPARWVRVELLASDQGLPRLDEIEVYEADPVDEPAAREFARRARRGPKPAAAEDSAPRLCLGSRQYLAEAEKRLSAHCADGAAFLMFDGNWWNGGCVNRDHGHPVPYLWEDHIRANIALAQRVHAGYPKVLIEMHDMLAGGSAMRMTPVYYKHGLPGSYDENWGFELMWDPMADLKEGRARALYYYNLGCNVPIYLHIDLRKDNEECIVLWWYASTCRHLGIGGTHANAAVVTAQKRAMQRYHTLERFYKRGEFYGLGEDIHLHVLPSENAFTVNLFNPSDQTRRVAGRTGLGALRLSPKRPISSADSLGRVESGELRIEAELPPWSARVAFFQ